MDQVRLKWVKLDKIGPSQSQVNQVRYKFIKFDTNGLS